MRTAFNLALVAGALVLGGALHAAARAREAAPGLAAGLAAGGLALAALLVALLRSRKAEDRDLLGSIVNALAAAALGLAVEQRLGSRLELAADLPPGGLHGGLVLLVATYLCARIALRRGDLGALRTRDLVRAALGSDRALEAAGQLLPARADALEPLLDAARGELGQARARALRLLGGVARASAPAARAPAVEAVAAALTDPDERVLVAAAGAARALAHPTLVGPLRGVRRPPAGTPLGRALLEARAACGDLDVIDDLLRAPPPEADADAARDLARALGAAALPALTERLGRASDEEAARLLALVGALPRSDEAYALAAARAGAEAAPAVRAAALRALCDLDPARAAPLAHAAAGADDLMVRTWAQSVLRAAGQEP